FSRCLWDARAVMVRFKNPAGFPGLNWAALAGTRRDGVKMAQSAGARSLSELRAKSAGEILKAAVPPGNPLAAPFGATIDGWALPDSVVHLFENGRQNDVPVLIGSNATEGALFMTQPVRAEAAREQARQAFGQQAEACLHPSPATSADEAKTSTTQSLGDAVCGLQMRTWARLQRKTGKAAAYLYMFDRIPPDAVCRCATHPAEIVYAFNNVGLS